MTNKELQNIELLQACIKLQILVKMGTVPARQDYSNEWAELRRRNYLEKNKRG